MTGHQMQGDTLTFGSSRKRPSSPQLSGLDPLRWQGAGTPSRPAANTIHRALQPRQPLQLKNMAVTLDECGLRRPVAKRGTKP